LPAARERTIEFLAHFRRLTSRQRNTFIACFLGWSLDAFDFFILTFCVSAIATEFHAQVAAVLEAVFLTLAMRPVGAFIFGMIADRYGRRPALMIDIVAFSVFELSSAFAPSLHIFLLTRALFGIAMGGEWGVGAALAFETLPKENRGFFSGLLQEGYVAGYLLAALVYGTLFHFIGWRGMFVVGALPAFLIIYIRTKVEESPAWRQGRAAAVGVPRNLGQDMVKYLGTFIFLVVLMFAFNVYSHGTQDIYPTFLEKNRGFAPKTVGLVAIVYNLGALLGGVLFGSWSERLGRRKTIVIAAILTIPMIPLWVYPHTAPMLALGSFLMQFMVQGAWGVIPAHLNELSPKAVRGTFPGLAYQLGNLLASRNSVIQAKVAARYFGGNYAPVLAWTALLVAVLVAIVTVSGREAKGADLSDTS
jgi:SHS family lactate transporter-like MFS transporter